MSRVLIGVSRERETTAVELCTRVKPKVIALCYLPFYLASEFEMGF